MISHRFVGIASLLTCLTLPACDRQLPDAAGLLSLTGGMPVDVMPDRVVDGLSGWFFDWRKRQLEEDGMISQDPGYIEPVERVLEHIKQAAAKSQYAATAQTFEWELLVVEDDSSYAGVFPGGKVIVHTGIFALATNEAGLAAVLGHEAIHALARHADQRITMDLVASLPVGAIAARTAADPEDFDPAVTVPVMAALGMGVFVGVDQPFSRQLESDADRQGMLLAASAGYDPEEALIFWIDLDRNREADYYSSHPASDQRLEDLQNSMEEIRTAYDQADMKRRSALLPATLVTG